MYRANVASRDVHGRTPYITSHRRKEDPVVRETSKMKINEPVGLTGEQNWAYARRGGAESNGKTPS